MKNYDTSQKSPTTVQIVTDDNFPKTEIISGEQVIGVILRLYIYSASTTSYTRATKFLKIRRTVARVLSGAAFDTGFGGWTQKDFELQQCTDWIKPLASDDFTTNSVAKFMLFGSITSTLDKMLGAFMTKLEMLLTALNMEIMNRSLDGFGLVVENKLQTLKSSLIIKLAAIEEGIEHNAAGNISPGTEISGTVSELDTKLLNLDKKCCNHFSNIQKYLNNLIKELGNQVMERISFLENAFTETLCCANTVELQERYPTGKKLGGDSDGGGYLITHDQAIRELRNIQDKMADSISSSWYKNLFQNLKTFRAARDPTDPTTETTTIRLGGTI
ncbi:hypothetical protein HOY82DRAFT_601512 [Tuber indicum]|nr:hypothetical protein HOY82DRAFT_601512 [Tuber indicum]